MSRSDQLTEEERAFYRLLSRLAGQGLFANHEDAIGQLIAAFEAAIEAQKRGKPADPGGPAGLIGMRTGRNY